MFVLALWEVEAELDKSRGLCGLLELVTVEGRAVILQLCKLLFVYVKLLEGLGTTLHFKEILELTALLVGRIERLLDEDNAEIGWPGTKQADTEIDS